MSASPSASASTSGSLNHLALERHGDRRRGQLVRVAAHIIEFEGVDSLRMPRVAEIAGCARTLVYRYFPSREDLFLAVISEFYERLEERMSPADQMAQMASLDDPTAALPLLEAIWDVTEETGTAGIILHASPRLGAQLGAQLDPESKRFEARWLVPLRAVGLGEIEATLVLKAAVAVLAELMDRRRRGEIDRKSAIQIGQRALVGLIEGFGVENTKRTAERA
jgi:AcrR family transcriptional regulator